MTVLKILVSYPDGFAVMEDLKRDMAILATSGREWADRTKRLAARGPDLDIFSHGLGRTHQRRMADHVQGTGSARVHGSPPRVRPNRSGALGRGARAAIVAPTHVPPLRQPADRAKRRRERRRANERGNAPEARSRSRKKPPAERGGLDSPGLSIAPQPQAYRRYLVCGHARPIYERASIRLSRSRVVHRLLQCR